MSLKAIHVHRATTVDNYKLHVDAIKYNMALTSTCAYKFISACMRATCEFVSTATIFTAKHTKLFLTYNGYLFITTPFPKHKF